MFLYKLTFPTYFNVKSQIRNLGKIFTDSPSVLIVSKSPSFINAFVILQYDRDIF